MVLDRYRKKRDFRLTPEPPGTAPAVSRHPLRFVIQKHAASRLHYDLRLESNGVLRSWAVPKGPSLVPGKKRLAVMVEDHPLEYRTFEGVIPRGYGAGTVMVWDHGFYFPLGQDRQHVKSDDEFVDSAIKNGKLHFRVAGKKLGGEFGLIRMRTGTNWLLMKIDDRFAAAKEPQQLEESAASGRTMEEIAAGGVPPRTVVPVAGCSEGRTAAMPHAVRPMLAETSSEPFEHPDWLFEIKWDGYRAIAEIDSGTVKLYSRNNKDFSARFPGIAKALSGVSRQTVLDGEVVAVDRAGKPDFGLLQNAARRRSATLIYYVFDMLYCDGFDLTHLPLSRRKRILRQALPPDSGAVRFSDHVAGQGMSMYRFAAAHGLEGVMAKQADSIYRPGVRAASWLKIKLHKRQEAVIVGYTPPAGGRKWFGSLALGVYDGKGVLTYIGNAGSGFDDKDLKDIFDRLRKSRMDVSPVARPPAGEIVWVSPELVCEVRFTEWTVEGVMRHPVFMGMRFDKDPRTVRKEPQTSDSHGWRYLARTEPYVDVPGRQVRLTNLNKIYWPAEKYTKGDLLEYYLNIAPYILPHINGRPQSLHRFPDGIEGQSFFHKNAGGEAPEWIRTFPVKDGDSVRSYILVSDVASLLYVVNLGCIDINVWNSTVRHPGAPDYIVFDLDPLDTSFRHVIDAARATHKMLGEIGAENFCKTSGATGLHIYVPAAARYSYQQAREFAYLVNCAVHRQLPGITSLERSPAKRRGRVYLDFLQNHIEATTAAPYSVRPRRTATVSTPLYWDEVVPGLDPARFTMRSVFARLSRAGDLWKGVQGPGLDMAACLGRLSSVLKSGKKSEEKRTVP